MRVLLVLVVVSWWGCGRQVETRNKRPLVVTKSGSREEEVSKDAHYTPWELKSDRLIPAFLIEMFTRIITSRKGGFDKYTTAAFTKRSPFQELRMRRNAARAIADPEYLGEIYVDIFEGDDPESHDMYHVKGGFWILRESEGFRVIAVNTASWYMEQRNEFESEVSMFLGENPLDPESDEAWIVPEMTFKDIDGVQGFARTIDQVQQWIVTTVSDVALGVRIAQLRVYSPNQYSWEDSILICADLN